MLRTHCGTEALAVVEKSDRESRGSSAQFLHKDGCETASYGEGRLRTKENTCPSLPSDLNKEGGTAEGAEGLATDNAVCLALTKKLEQKAQRQMEGTDAVTFLVNRATSRSAKMCESCSSVWTLHPNSVLKWSLLCF